MSKKDERLNNLIEILKRQKGVPIKELALLLNVSEMTIRRDLDTLKANNIVLNIPGAAVLNVSHDYMGGDDRYQLSQAIQSHIDEKERIV